MEGAARGREEEPAALVSVLPCPFPRASQTSSGSRKLLEKGRPGVRGSKLGEGY